MTTLTAQNIRSRMLKDVAINLPFIINLELWADMELGTDTPRAFNRDDFEQIKEDVKGYLNHKYPDSSIAHHAVELAQVQEGLGAFTNQFGSAYGDTNFLADAAPTRIAESMRESLLGLIKVHANLVLESVT